MGRYRPLLYHAGLLPQANGLEHLPGRPGLALKFCNFTEGVSAPISFCEKPARLFYVKPRVVGAGRLQAITREYRLQSPTRSPWSSKTERAPSTHYFCRRPPLGALPRYLRPSGTTWAGKSFLTLEKLLVVRKSQVRQEELLVTGRATRGGKSCLGWGSCPGSGGNGTEGAACDREEPPVIGRAAWSSTCSG